MRRTGALKTALRLRPDCSIRIDILGAGWLSLWDDSGAMDTQSLQPNRWNSISLAFFLTWGLLTFGAFAIALALVAGCSKEDKVISVAPDDAEMNAAIAKARETLPEFWQVFDKPEHGEKGFALKVRTKEKRSIFG